MIDAKNKRQMKHFYDELYGKKFSERVEDPSIYRATGIIENLLKIKKGRLLDIACGTGSIINSLQHNNAKFFGVDISEFAVKNAAKSPDSYFLCSDAENLPFASQSFDFVILNHILEHIENDKKCILDVSRILKSKGRVYIGSPNNRKTLLFLIRPYRWFIDKKEGHVKPGYSFIEIKNLLEENGFEIKYYQRINNIFRMILYPMLLNGLAILHWVYKKIDRKQKRNKYNSYNYFLYKLMCLSYKIEDRLFYNSVTSNDFYLMAEKVK